MHKLDLKQLKAYEESLPQYQNVTLADLVNNPEAYIKQSTWVRLNGVIEKRAGSLHKTARSYIEGQT